MALNLPSMVDNIQPSVTDNVQSILAGLRSPMRHNTGCIFQMFQACCLMGCTKAKPPPELLRAAMQFLVGPRMSGEHEALTQRLLSCRCTTRISPPATLKPFECLDLFISHLCDILVAQLRDLRPAKFRGRKSNRAARRQPWPNCVADIGLQNGTCGDLLQSLLLWTRVSPAGAGLYTLIGSLARFWAPLGQELVTSTVVVRSMRHTLLGSAQFFEVPVPSRSADFFRRAVHSCRILWTAIHFVDAEVKIKHHH
ncbi:hypothetical protein B0H16DRAFT_1879783 [Mycena metata]|uniref:Uncharacterized protein n=1 Tax=Mycena metata TaxID=1033252 RepID=A0AAD7JZY4_9AGAR|nr:hypothetical protein B0H16DRAFT_1879783 [Mycena metata]